VNRTTGNSFSFQFSRFFADNFFSIVGHVTLPTSLFIFFAFLLDNFYPVGNEQLLSPVGRRRQCLLILLADPSVPAGQSAVNVLLSLDETYSNLSPTRLSPSSPSAFVSIQEPCSCQNSEINLKTFGYLSCGYHYRRSVPIETVLYLPTVLN
jgi:hypothetical protein